MVFSVGGCERMKGVIQSSGMCIIKSHQAESQTLLITGLRRDSVNISQYVITIVHEDS